MPKKIVIIGGVAGGASFAARLRRLSEDAEIIILERGEHVSFSNCSLPYYLSRIINESASLIMMTPERLKRQYNIDARTRCEATEIDRDRKTVTVKNLTANENYTLPYDVLVLSPGAAPILPRSIEGIDRENVFSVRNVSDIIRLDEYIHARAIKDIAVVGGGFIGCEIAENLAEAKLNVTLVEAMNQIMTPFDFDMVQILHKEMLDNGIDLILGDGVSKVTDGKIVLKSGREIKSEAVVMAIGVAPETQLAKAAGLEIGTTGGIKVNNRYQTSDKNIYAIGDAIEVYNSQTKKPMRLALAWPAQMEARDAADAVMGCARMGRGFIGSSVIRIFKKIAASTGLNERIAKECGIPYDTALVIPFDKVSLMPDAAPIHLKLLFETPTGRILGAQAIGEHDAHRLIDIIASVIHFHGTIYDLSATELCYAPVVSTAKDAAQMAALVAENLLERKFRQVHLDKLRDLVEQKAVIIDVREKGEYNAGHIEGATNIPLSELRSRTDEIPKDVPVYVHCRTSQRSYNACMALKGMGFENVHNMQGSYLAISIYEAMQEKLYGKKKILTNYNFN